MLSNFSDDESGYKQGLIMDLDYRANPSVIRGGLIGVVRFRPTKNPIGFVAAHVDAAMTHGKPKVFMPIRAMEGVTGGCEK